MSDNKFIKRLKGEQTAKSVLEIKNESAKTSFANMPQGTSNAIDVFSDHRGNATAVLNGTTNWKVSNSELLLADAVSGDGQDFTSTYSVSGSGLWVNASYTFPSTGDPRHPVAMVFNPSTKWVLKVCGDNLIVDGGSTVDFTMLVKIGTASVYSKNFTIRESAGQFSKEFIIDFGEANSDVIKAGGLSTLTVQLLCGTANASARIYNGMTVLTCLQRKVDASAVSNSSANVEDVLDGNIIPSDYFSNPAFIDQIEDGDTAVAIFARDGDDVNLDHWEQPIPDRTGNAGKFLQTPDGDKMSWKDVEISDVTGLQTELNGLQGQITTNKNTMDLHIGNTNNPHQVTKAQVGLSNVDNTSDLNKPISTATQTALDLKADKSTTYTKTETDTLLSGKQDTISDLSTIRSNAQAGKAASDTIATYGDIVTHNVAEFATAAQGAKADTALQAGDNVSELVNDAGYLTQHQTLADLGITATASEINVLDGITANTTELNYTDGVTSNIQTQLNAKQATISDLATIRSGAAAGATAVQPGDLATVATTGSYSDLSGTPTIGNATLTIQKNSVAVDTFTANATVDKSINITVPVNAADVNALPDSTKYVANASMTINNTTYVVTLQLKDQDGNNIGTAQTIDLPLESVVVGGSYDSTNKKIVLTLKDGSTIDIPVADLVAGLQSEITSTNKLDADLVDDSTSTNKFVTAGDKTTWNGKQDAISDLATIRSNASNGASAYTTIQGYGNIVTHNASEFATSAQGALADTALQSGDNVSELVNDAGYITDITGSDVTTALGYTPYNSSNPSGYQANVIESIKVNGTAQTITAKAVDITVPTKTSDLNNDSGFITSSALAPYALSADLATVATTGDYDDLSNKPTIPTVGNGTITITQGGINKGTFTTNQSGNTTIALDAGGGGGGYHPDLFDWKWADHELDDVQWVRADTFSWQAGTTYEVAYNHLVNDYDSGAVSSFWFNDGAETLLGTRSAGNDTTHGGVNYYAWTNLTTGIIYTTSKKPSVGDTVYNSSFVSSYTIDSLVSGARTETISGTTVTYYLADDGHKICLADQESNVTAIYNATGVAWYYILDTVSQRFKLPRTQFGVTGLRDAVGSYVEAGLPNITGGIGLSTTQMSSSGAFTHWQSGGAQGWDGWNNQGNRGFSFDASRSSSVYGNSDTVQPKATEMYLYFYVGNFTQTALENTAGLNTELFNGKADLSVLNTKTAHVVTEFQAPTADNGYMWYRKYADGWVEQGQSNVTVNEQSTVTKTLPITMANTYYTALAQNNTLSTAGDTENGVGIQRTSVTQIKLFTHYINPNTINVSWQVSGMAA